MNLAMYFVVFLMTMMVVVGVLCVMMERARAAAVLLEGKRDFLAENISYKRFDPVFVIVVKLFFFREREILPPFSPQQVIWF